MTSEVGVFFKKVQHNIHIFLGNIRVISELKVTKFISHLNAVENRGMLQLWRFQRAQEADFSTYKRPPVQIFLSPPVVLLLLISRYVLVR